MSETARLPLAGIRVLELGTTIAGPFCARLMGDFGAEVIKVEALDGDPIRTTGKRFQGVPLYAASLSRNKRLVAVDLRKPEGQEIVRKLVPQCDILIENFRPGTLEKWGLGYEELSTLNRGLIMVRVSGYGQTGPYRQRPGYGVVCEAVGGLRYVNGDPGTPPARANIALTDCITGLYAALGAMMALNHRHRTGEGQVIDTALYECAFSLMEMHVPAYEKLGYVAEREGSGLTDSVINNLFTTQDGVYLHIQGSQTNSFRRLCEAMGRPELFADARFQTRAERVKHQAEIEGIVGEWVAARNYNDAAQALSAGDVVFTRIYSMADIFNDPHYAARGMLARVPDDNFGAITLPAPVPRLSRTPGRIVKSGGQVGEHTREVLREFAGMTEAEITQLESAQVVKCHPVVNTASLTDPGQTKRTSSK
jgi:crotonobetainyl-CoA:carnitine CoA-transferase CaiB-like acyl-CoA transferase